MLQPPRRPAAHAATQPAAVVTPDRFGASEHLAMYESLLADRPDPGWLVVRSDPSAALLEVLFANATRWTAVSHLAGDRQELVVVIEKREPLRRRVSDRRIAVRGRTASLFNR